MHARFGELLSKWVRLSPHDVNEILEEQLGSRRRFGQIALAWGLCQPEHVWRAWAEQAIGDGAGDIDLRAIGIDATLVPLMPADVARRQCAIPVRHVDDQLIVAVPKSLDESARQELRDALPGNVRFVHADPAHIREAIETYYHAG